MSDVKGLLSQFEVYLDGEMLQENITEVHIPKMEWNDVNPTMKNVTTLKPVVAAIKVRDISPKGAAAFDSADGATKTRLEIRGLQVVDNTTQPLWEYVGLGRSETVEDVGETTLAINAHWFRHSVDGKEILFGDIMKNILRIKGEDING